MTNSTQKMEFSPEQKQAFSSIDQRAWELAKIAKGPGAELRDVIEKSNEIKAALLKEQQ